jgi:hypothetical protein
MNRIDTPWYEKINIDAPHAEHVKWLNKITDETGAQLVISSAWRDEFSTLGWMRYLALLGVTGKIHGKTDHLGTYRGVEVLTYILKYQDLHWKDAEKHEPLESFVCIDDDSDFDIIKDTLVLCNSETGLMESEANKAIELLNKKISLNIQVKYEF